MVYLEHPQHHQNKRHDNRDGDTAKDHAKAPCRFDAVYISRKTWYSTSITNTPKPGLIRIRPLSGAGVQTEVGKLSGLRLAFGLL